MTTSHLSLSILSQYLDAYPWTGYTKPKRFSYTKKREPGSNFMWLTRSFVKSKGGTASVFNTEETYEAYLYTADQDAWKEALRILRVYPGTQVAAYTNSFETAALVSEFTAVGTGTVARSSTYKQAGSYSMKISGAFDGTYTKAQRTYSTRVEVVDTYILRGTGTVPGTPGVYVDNGAAEQLVSCYFSGTDMIAMNGTYNLGAVNAAQWYHVRFEINYATSKVDIYLDGTKVVTEASFDLAHTPDTTSIIRYMAAPNDAGYEGLFIDTHVHGTYPLIDLYYPQKTLNPDCQYLGISPYNKNDEVWKFTIKYEKLEAVT